VSLSKVGDIIHLLMIKKGTNIISGLTCLVFTVVIALSAPNVAYAAEGGGSSDAVKSNVEPLPYVIIGALVLFAGILIFDIIFHPLEEKKDDGKKTVHAKVPEPKTTKSQPKPKYSTDYDYLLGMSAAQSTQQVTTKLSKVKQNP
jgi:hypothetical protein